MKKFTTVAIKLILCAVMLIDLSACATVFTGTSTNVTFNASDGRKSKAVVTSASGTQNVTLPTMLSIRKAKQPISIVIKDKCYEQTSYSAGNKVNFIFYCNFLFGLLGTTSAGVDVSDGAMWTYDENIIVPVHRIEGCE